MARFLQCSLLTNQSPQPLPHASTTCAANGQKVHSLPCHARLPMVHVHVTFDPGHATHVGHVCAFESLNAFSMQLCTYRLATYHA